jgi:hypothetical protein
MSRVETLESIEIGLRSCRDLSSSIGENVLAYMIDMAIFEAREPPARDRQQWQVYSSGASAPVAPVRTTKIV